MKSPCIKVCTLEGDICIGCFRTQDEIREWMIFTDKQKKETLEKIKIRKIRALSKKSDDKTEVMKYISNNKVVCRNCFQKLDSDIITN